MTSNDFKDFDRGCPVVMRKGKEMRALLYDQNGTLKSLK
jgi:hypothetical protein